MNILRRHMLKEVVLATGLTTGGFLFVMIVGNVMKDHLPSVLSGRLPWSSFAQVLLMLIPSVAPYVMPIGMLTGTLLVLGRMSAQNEITAMKSAGMSLASIAAPIVALGLAGTIIAGFVNLEYSPRATRSIKQALADGIREDPLVLITPKTAGVLQDFTIYADRREGDTLRDVWIWQRDKAGRGTEHTRADAARLVPAVSRTTGDPAGVMILKLTGVVVEHRAAGANEPVSIGGFRESSDIEIPMSALLRGEGPIKKKLRWHTLSEMLALRDTGYDLKPDASDEQRFANRILIQFEIQSALSGAFGILSLTLLAIPLGIRVARSETFVNLGVGLGVSLLYYFAGVAFRNISNPHLRPDILVWIPNLVVQALAFRLFRRASRH